MQNTFDKLTIHVGNTIVGINPEGGYVSSWRLGETDNVLYQGQTQKRTGIPILFPYFGKAEGKRQHGFGRDSMWTVTDISDTSVSMSLTSEQISEDAKKEYPYPCIARITVQVLADESLAYTLEVQNTGNAEMPISPGLHPYWAVPHSEKTKIIIEGIDGFDATKIDWENNPPDLVFQYSGKTVVKLPQREITIEDITENGPALKHIVVWSQTPQKEDYNFVCVEPVCGKNEALHENPILIAPGKSWKMKIKFTAKTIS